ncbi:MAG: alpha/beta hydrolase family protein [Armatimonadota bacterium]
MEEFLLRCASPSDTFGLVRNSLLQGVYVLHGDADDNVPVTQARMMRERLTEFHHDFEYFEQPGLVSWQRHLRHHRRRRVPTRPLSRPQRRTLR